MSTHPTPTHTKHPHPQYSAKVTAVRSTIQEATGLGVVEYRLHYFGWKSQWDEWVTVDRLLAHNDENAALRDRLARESRGAATAGPGGAGPPDGAAAASGQPRMVSTSRFRWEGGGEQGRNTRAEREGGVIPDGWTDGRPMLRGPRGGGDAETARKMDSNNSQPTKGLNLNPKTETEVDERWAPNMGKYFSNFIPHLKERMVQDWEFVCKRNGLYSLPRKTSARSVLEDFVATAASRGTFGGELLRAPRSAAKTDEFKVTGAEARQFVSGLTAMFETLIGVTLSYEPERLQLMAAQRQLDADGSLVKLIDYYGAEHLLRFVYLSPELLAQNAPGLADRDAEVFARAAQSLGSYLAEREELFIEGKLLTGTVGMAR